MGTILYCYACEINQIWLYSIHILLIVWQLLVNLIKIFLMCVAGKQWETPWYTIEVCSSRVLWLIAHYCAVAWIILYLGFLQFVLAHVGPAVRGLDPLFDQFCIWGNEMSMNISQVKKLRKIVRIKKLATKNNKIFVCTMKKTSVHYRMVLTIIHCLFYSFAPFPI